MRRGGQGFSLLLDVGRIVPFHGLFQFFQSLFDSFAGLFIDLVAMFFEGLFSGINQAVGLIAHLDQFLFLLVLVGMGLGVLDHFVDLFVAKTGRGGNTDRLLLAGAEVLGGNMQNTVGVDIEGDLDLWHAPRSGGDADQLKTANGLVAFRHFPLALQHVNRYRRLIVGRSGENLAFFARDGSVFFDEFGHHRTEGFNTQGQGRDVEQQYILDVSLENSTLNGSADSYHFIWIDPLVRRLVEDFLYLALHRRHAGHAADQQYLIDIRSGQPGILDSSTARTHQLIEKAGTDAFQLGAGQLDVHVLGTGLIGGDKRQVDVGLHGAGEFTFCLFAGFLEALQGHLVAPQIDALVFFELGSHIVDDVLIKVLAAEEGVAVGRFNLEYAVTQLENGDIKGTAAKVKDRDLLFALLVHAVSQRSGSWLVDDTQYLEAGDLTGVLGGLTLGIVEISGDRNDRFGYRLAQIIFGGLLHLLQNHGRNFRRAILFAAGFNPSIAVVGVDDLKGADLNILAHRIAVVLTADQALDGEQGILRISHRLALSLLTHQTLTALGKGDHGRRGPGTFCIGDDDGLATFHNGNT